MSSGSTIREKSQQIPFGFAAQVSFNPRDGFLLLLSLHVAHNFPCLLCRIFIDTDAACYHGMQ